GDDPDHFAILRIPRSQTDALPDRILVGPQEARERTIDDHDRRRAGAVPGGELAAPIELHPEQRERAGRQRGERALRRVRLRPVAGSGGEADGTSAHWERRGEGGGPPSGDRAGALVGGVRDTRRRGPRSL